MLEIPVCQCFGNFPDIFFPLCLMKLTRLLSKMITFAGHLLPTAPQKCTDVSVMSRFILTLPPHFFSWFEGGYDVSVHAVPEALQ